MHTTHALDDPQGSGQSYMLCLSLIASYLELSTAVLLGGGGGGGQFH